MKSLFVAAAQTTAHGALLTHMTGGHIETMIRSPIVPADEFNFGLFPPVKEHPAFDRHSKIGRFHSKDISPQGCVEPRALADLGSQFQETCPRLRPMNRCTPIL